MEEAVCLVEAGLVRRAAGGERQLEDRAMGEGLFRASPRLVTADTGWKTMRGLKNGKKNGSSVT